MRSPLARWPGWCRVLFDDGKLLDVLLTKEHEGSRWVRLTASLAQDDDEVDESSSDHESSEGAGADESQDEISDSEEEPVCAICLDELSQLPCCETQCSHRFHRRCMESWLDSGSVCPLCMRHVMRRRLQMYD